jgi:hypothetical protein
MDIFSCFGMWDLCPEFVCTFRLHPVMVKEWDMMLSNKEVPSG